MADLHTLQEALRDNAAIRAEIAADPTMGLSQHGVTLSPQQADRLQRQTRNMSGPLPGPLYSFHK